MIKRRAARLSFRREPSSDVQIHCLGICHRHRRGITIYTIMLVAPSCPWIIQERTQLLTCGYIPHLAQSSVKLAIAATALSLVSPIAYLLRLLDFRLLAAVRAGQMDVDSSASLTGLDPQPSTSAMCPPAGAAAAPQHQSQHQQQQRHRPTITPPMSPSSSTLWSPSKARISYSDRFIPSRAVAARLDFSVLDREAATSESTRIAAGREVSGKALGPTSTNWGGVRVFGVTWGHRLPPS